MFMMTIQELHAYQKLVEMNCAIPVICITDQDHGKMIPWVNEERPCFMCLACDTKIYPGLKMAESIRETLFI
jgi:hypothetical protein